MDKENEKASVSHEDLGHFIQRDLASGEISEAAVIAEGEDRITVFVWLLVFCSSISGLLFGYDTGVISGTLVSIGTDLGSTLSSGQKELITSATTLGALLGSIVAGVISDFSGRRAVLGVADIIFIAGAILQACSHAVWPMIGGRLLVGVGVGLASCIAPLYVQELAPTKQRGRMVVVTVVAITGGQVIAYGIGAAFENMKGGWRYMVGLGSVPAAIQLVFLFLLPESPRILIRRGRLEETKRNIQKIYPFATPQQIEMKVQVLHASVLEAIEITERTTLFERFKTMITVAANRRALIIGCGLQLYQQLSGFNTLMYWSATLFKSIGFSNPTAVGLIIAGTNFLFTLVALKYIDIVGRRRIMLWTAPGMVFGLTLASIAFYFLTRSTDGVLIDGHKYLHSWSAIVLLSMIIYVASYATGLGNIPWNQGELFSLDVRGIGTSLSTACNWSANLLISSTYLSLMDKITPAGSFGFYAGLCFLGWIFCLFCFPETAGLSLEEVTMIFKDGFGIKESVRLREEKKALALRLLIQRSDGKKEDTREKVSEDETENVMAV